MREANPNRVHFHELADGSRYLRWRNVFEFHLSPDSKVITGHSLDGSPEAAFKTYMLGHLLSFALIGLGIETIHAASVVLDGEAIAITGDSARGKSTLSAAFLQAGYSLLCDDFLVLRPNGQEYVGYPGLPRIKLYERVAEHLAPKGKVGVPMSKSHRPKIIYALDDILDPVPVRVFYALASPRSVGGLKGVHIEHLTERQAYLELTENSFNITVKTPERLASQFEWATELVKRVPVKRLSYPRVLSILPEVIAAVQEDLAAYGDTARSALASTLPKRTP
ncbi:MAG: hypothetical protein ABIP81_08350 [Terriglobales bacterium]